MPVLPLPLFHLFPAQAEAEPVRHGGHGRAPLAFEADYLREAQRSLARLRDEAEAELVAVI